MRENASILVKKRGPAGLFFRLGRRGTAAAGIAQVFEELRTGVDHQHIALVAETAAIGFHAAVEVVELGILAECRRVGGGCLGIAVTAHPLGVTIGFGKNHFALAIGVSLDFFLVRRAGGTQFVGHAL